MFALGLRAITVNGGGVDAITHQLARKAVAIYFFAQKHQYLRHFARLDQVGEQCAFVFRSHLIHLMRHQIGGRVAPCDFNQQRVFQHLPGELFDVLGECGREQQALPLRGQQGENAPQVGQKAHIEHAVGLVEHKDLHLRQIHRFLFDVIKQASGCSHQHFHARHQCGFLRFHVHTAVHHGGAQRQMFAVAPYGFFHLCGEFARGGEDQRAHRMPRGRRTGIAMRRE